MKYLTKYFCKICTLIYSTTQSMQYLVKHSLRSRVNGDGWNARGNLELNDYMGKCSEQISDGNHCMLWNGFPRTADRIISQAQYWLIVSFSRRNWERELQTPDTFWREIKVVHLLRNASGERERCSEEVGTEEMKGESGERKDSSVHTFPSASGESQACSRS